jgi:hypothetical protein
MIHTEKKQIFFIVFFGLFLRMFFYFFGAELYYGTKHFFTLGDSIELFSAGKNLVDNGIFSTDLNYPDGVFKREPGYSILMAIFYILSFKNIELTFCLLAIFQIAFDSFCIYVVFKIIKSISNNHYSALIGATLYAVYPFAIFWTSIAYAEIFGVNLCLISVYFSSKNKIKYHFLSGGIAAYASLVRPQLFLLIFAYLSASFILIFIKKYQSKKQLVLYILGFILIYACWPIRNLVNHKELVIFKKTENTSRDMSADRISFAYFMWSVKTDWEPQISQLLAGETVEMPEWVWKMSEDDSMKLMKAITLSYECGDGFRQLRRLPPLPEDVDCTEEVTALWKELREIVITKRPLQYYVKVPFGNLKKSIFKNSLIKSFNRADKPVLINQLVNLLFSYRTLLLILGAIGCFLMLFQINAKENLATYYIIFYIMGLYFWLCFIYRDMDIRYLLPADVLLIIPASFLIYRIINYFKLQITKS